MRGDYDMIDEYEDDGFIQHHDEEQGRRREYEEDGEKVRKLSKEELNFLKRRQWLKELKRKQLMKEYGVDDHHIVNSNEKKKKDDNYGSFFGPSEHFIAPRVIQESKSLLENQHLQAARVSTLQSKKSSTTATSRPEVVNDAVKQKAQRLKESRDYSFLNDEELPAGSKPRNVSLPNSGSASSKCPKSVGSSSRPVSNGREQRTHVSKGHHQVQTKAGQHKVAPGSRPNSTSANPRKQLGISSAANQPDRSIGTKGLPSKMSVPTKTPTSSKTKSHSFVTGVQKATLSKSHSPEWRREIRGELDRGRVVMPKQSVSLSRPPIKPPKQNSSRAPMQNDRPKKRPPRPFVDEDEDEDDDPISIIRKISNYNPKKYARIDDGNDSDMEVGFDDILKEEKYSAKVAREEDARELRLIEEEERREHMRKEAKRP